MSNPVENQIPNFSRENLKNTGKEFGKHVGQTVSNAALSLLEGLANWVGLGHLVRDISKFGVKELGGIDVDKTKSLLRKIVSYAMTNENIALDQLQSKLDKFSTLFPNSNIKGFIFEQKNKIKSALEQGKRKAAKVQAGLESAEVKLANMEDMTAGEIATEFKDRYQEVRNDIDAALKDSNQGVDYESIEQKFK